MIYCFGDSFTYGDELADKQRAWPTVLGKKLDCIAEKIYEHIRS